MFIRPEEIMMDLSRTYKNKNFSLHDIIEWCMQVETEHICDVDIMNKYVLTTEIANGKIVLPNNVYRILSIYDDNNVPLRKSAVSGIYIHGLSEYNGKILNVEFLGVPLDDDCMPLIAASHKMACMQYVIMQLFAEEADYDISKWKMQSFRKEEFSAMVTAAKQGYREWSEDAINSLLRFKYNEPFKDLQTRYNQRIGMIGIDANYRYVQGKGLYLPSGQYCGHVQERDIPTSTNVREIMDQYVALINDRLESIITTKSMTFILGTDGTFISDIWTISLPADLSILTYESSVVTLFESNKMIIAPIECNATEIKIDLTNIYDSTKTYTIAVVPPSN